MNVCILKNVNYYLKNSQAKVLEYTISSTACKLIELSTLQHLQDNCLSKTATYIDVIPYKLAQTLFPADDMPFRACDLQEKGLTK